VLTAALALLGAAVYLQQGDGPDDTPAERTRTQAGNVHPYKLVEEQVALGSRRQGSVGYEQWHAWLHEHVPSDLQLREYVQEVPYTTSEGQQRIYRNVLWRVAPDKPRRVILATHYDTKAHAHEDRRNPTAPVPGANDGASGVAVLVALAHRFEQASTSAAVGVDMVFFDGEEGEPGIGGDFSAWTPIGSTYFASHLSELYGENMPEWALVVDMVCDKDLAIHPEISSFGGSQEFTERFFRFAQHRAPDAFRLDLVPAILDDHTPLQHAGIPSTLAIDFSYPFWHTTADTPDKCSARSLETVVEVIYEYLDTL